MSSTIRMHFIWMMMLLAPGLAAAGPRIPLIMLDPGHGGSADGAISASGLKEKQIMLDLARRLTMLLRKHKFRVSLTRSHDHDEGLVERIAMANVRKADLFLSLHANASGNPQSGARGIEVFFLSTRPSSRYAASVAKRENAIRHLAQGPALTPINMILKDLTRNAAHTSSQKLAALLLDHTVKATGARSRGVFQAPFVVLTGARMPAALIEVGFLDNVRESKLLATVQYRQKLAQGIAAAISAFFQRRNGTHYTAALYPKAP